MNWIYVRWWKWLCAGILFYVIAGSFIVPLAPGISKVDPLTILPDSVYTFHIKTYNAHLKNRAAGKVQLWFKGGNDYFCPNSIEVAGENEIIATFGVRPNELDSLQSSNFDIVANDEVDGTFALREGVILVGKDRHQISNTDSSIAATSNTPPLNKKCGVEVTHNKHQFLAFPYREILYETIRNTFFHVPMWFVMSALALFSLIFSLVYLLGGDIKADIYASNAIIAALLFGACGYLTGMVWAKYTWFIGMGWFDVLRSLLLSDIKLSGALLAIAVYLVYVVLRSSIEDEKKRAKVSAWFNIFALIIFAFFIFIIPRLTNSLHPGNGGNPAFSKYDLDGPLRLFFYPAVIGWILLGFWILSILIRIELLSKKQTE